VVVCAQEEEEEDDDDEEKKQEERREEPQKKMNQTRRRKGEKERGGVRVCRRAFNSKRRQSRMLSSSFCGIARHACLRFLLPSLPPFLPLFTPFLSEGVDTNRNERIKKRGKKQRKTRETHTQRKCSLYYFKSCRAILLLLVQSNLNFAFFSFPQYLSVC